MPKLTLYPKTPGETILSIMATLAAATLGAALAGALIIAFPWLGP